MKLVHSLNKTLLITAAILTIIGVAAGVYISTSYKRDIRNTIVVSVVSITTRELMQQLEIALNFAFSKVDTKSVTDVVSKSFTFLDESVSGVTKEVKKQALNVSEASKTVNKKADESLREGARIKKQIADVQTSLQNVSKAQNDAQTLLNNFSPIIPIKGLSTITNGINQVGKGLSDVNKGMDSTSKAIDQAIAGINSVVEVSNKIDQSAKQVVSESDKVSQYLNTAREQINTAIENDLKKTVIALIRKEVDAQMASMLGVSPEVAKMMSQAQGLNIFSAADRGRAAFMYAAFQGSNNEMIKKAMAQVSYYFNAVWWFIAIVIFVVCCLPGLACLYFFLKSTSVFLTCPHCKGSIPKNLLYFTPLLKHLQFWKN